MHHVNCAACGASFSTEFSTYLFCEECTRQRPCPTEGCANFRPQRSSVCSTCSSRKAVALGKDHRKYKRSTEPRVITCRGLDGCTSLINRYEHPRTYICELCRPVINYGETGKRKQPVEQSVRRERGKLSARLKKYNLSFDQYMDLLERQGWVCAICRRDDATHNFTGLCVDHDHRCCPGSSSCGKCVRGLVCNKCNLALGYLDDDPHRAHALAAYLGPSVLQGAHKETRSGSYSMTYESRHIPFEVRDTGNGLTLEGLAAVFDSPTEIYERGRTFIEKIAPGAFARTVNAKDRIIMQYDHGQHPFFGQMPIGRIDSLRETPEGLHVTASLNDNWMTEPIRSAIANGAVTGMSFRFSVPEGGDTWDRSGDMPVRTITEVKLYELGPVTSPAYEATTVGVRSALALLTDEEREQVFRQISDPEEDANAQALIAQMQQLAAQLVQIETSAFMAGDDTVEEIQQVVSMLCSLDCLASDEAESDMGDTQMASATPEEGSLRYHPATPEEGSRPRTRSVRQALARLHDVA